MKYIIPLSAFVVLCLSACAAQFSEPKSGPTAKLRIKSAGAVTYTWVHTYGKPNCVDPQWLGSIGDPDKIFPAHTPKGMLGSASGPNPNVIEQTLPAKPTTLLFTQHGPHSGSVVRTCSLSVSFNAEPGSEYEVAYGFDEKRCFASVDKLMLVEGRVERVPDRKAVKQMGACSPYVF